MVIEHVDRARICKLIFTWYRSRFAGNLRASCPCIMARSNVNRRFLPHNDSCYEAVLLARPIEAEIVFLLLRDLPLIRVCVTPRRPLVLLRVFLDKPQTVTPGTLDIHLLYKGVEIYASFFTFIAPSCTSSSNTRNLSSNPLQILQYVRI